MRIKFLIFASGCIFFFSKTRMGDGEDEGVGSTIALQAPPEEKKSAIVKSVKFVPKKPDHDVGLAPGSPRSVPQRRDAVARGRRVRASRCVRRH